jgi:hypothetical protein
MRRNEYEKTVSRLMAYSAVGMEMIVPVGLGIAIDLWRGWMPACTILGVGFGLFVGIADLIRLNRDAGK